MPNFGTYAICPFYISEDMLTIRCEGIVPENNSTYVMRFKDTRMKKAWLDKYCETYGYCNCPYAAILESSYDDQGQFKIKTRPSTISAPAKKTSGKKYKNIEGQLSLNLKF